MNPDSPADMIWHPGDRSKPSIVLIHGLGMDSTIWIEPERSLILGGSLPITVLLSQPPGEKLYTPGQRRTLLIPEISAGMRPTEMNTIYDDLRERAYPVVTWSQKRPAGPVDVILPELVSAVDKADGMSDRGVILIGHSRGGLVGRKYLLSGDRRVIGLITLSAPHSGSSIATLASYISPLAELISPFFHDRASRSMMKSTLKRIIDFLKSRAVLELLPGSPLLRSLQNKSMPQVFSLSLGGTSPTLFSLYRLRQRETSEGARERILAPQKIFSFPGSLGKIIPGSLYPEEMKGGKGDGLVTAESALLPWGGLHFNFALNHAAILFDKKARDCIIRALESHC